MRDKECCEHDDNSGGGLFRRLFTAILTLVILILLIWLTSVQPNPSSSSKTRPYTPSAAVTFQVTISSHNHRIGVYYDHLSLYAAYQNQQITLPTLLPPTYQGHKDVSLWSPFIYGTEVPVAPYLTAALWDCVFPDLLDKSKALCTSKRKTEWSRQVFVTSATATSPL